jgi:hypothetical protein
MPNYFRKDWPEQWKEERKAGKKRFVIYNMVFFLLACIAVNALITRSWFDGRDSLSMAKEMAFYLLGGLGYGLLGWWYNERQLNKRENNQS